MKDKEKQKELVKILVKYDTKCHMTNCDNCKHNNFSDTAVVCRAKVQAREILKHYQPKLHKDSVVLSKEEYEEKEKQIKDLKYALKVHSERLDHFYNLNEDVYYYEEKQAEAVKQASKETAEKILNDIGNHLKKYAHIHKLVEKAKKSTEEYADGTPVEMESVWDVITLNKNGYADYETMNELQDNIENIALSRLLQEFEKDFRLYAKQIGVEIKE